MSEPAPKPAGRRTAMNNYLRIVLLCGLTILIVYAIAIRLLGPMDLEVPPWALVVMNVLEIIENIAILTAIIYTAWHLYLALWPR